MRYKNIVSIFFLLTIAPQSDAMLAYIKDCVDSVKYSPAVKQIMDNVALRKEMARIGGKRRQSDTKVNYSYGELQYTIHVIKEPDSQNIQAHVSCNNSVITHKVNALLAQENKK